MGKTARRAMLIRIVEYGVKYSIYQGGKVIKRYADYFKRLV